MRAHLILIKPKHFYDTPRKSHFMILQKFNKQISHVTQLNAPKKNAC